MMVTLGDECKRYANNFYTFESNLEIQRKTMVIRYEDLALNPMKYSRKVYKFLGVKFTDSIEQMMKDAIEPPKKEIKDKGSSVNITPLRISNVTWARVALQSTSRGDV